ncbi:MAG: hypothetical protein AAF171_24060 [Cyanobacteria bacterium P01_A01_bin.116]
MTSSCTLTQLPTVSCPTPQVVLSIGLLSLGVWVSPSWVPIEGVTNSAAQAASSPIGRVNLGHLSLVELNELRSLNTAETDNTSFTLLRETAGNDTFKSNALNSSNANSHTPSLQTPTREIFFYHATPAPQNQFALLPGAAVLAADVPTNGQFSLVSEQVMSAIATLAPNEPANTAQNTVDLAWIEELLTAEFNNSAQYAQYIDTEATAHSPVATTAVVDIFEDLALGEPLFEGVAFENVPPQSPSASSLQTKGNTHATAMDTEPLSPQSSAHGPKIIDLWVENLVQEQLPETNVGELLQAAWNDQIELALSHTNDRTWDIRNLEFQMSNSPTKMGFNEAYFVKTTLSQQLENQVENTMSTGVNTDSWVESDYSFLVGS